MRALSPHIRCARASGPAPRPRPGSPSAYSWAVSTAPVKEPEVISHEALEPALPWITLVWNDPVNLMSYVTWVFQTYFGYPRPKAEKLMMDVHVLGKAVVSHGSREEMERDAMALQGYGLWATFEKDE